MVKSNIPDELRTNLVDDGVHPQSMWVETRTIEPVSGAGQRNVRFLMPKDGILTNSYITFQVVAGGAGQCLPQWAGCMSALDSCRLSVGGSTLSTSRGVGQLWTLKNFYRTPANRNQKQVKRVGGNWSMAVDNLATDLPADAGCWGVDPGGFGVQLDDAAPATARQTQDGYKITQDVTTTPTWQVECSDIWNVLYSNHLPLSLLSDQVTMDLTLTEEQTQGDRTVGGDGVAWTAGTQYVNFKLHVDLVFYEDEIGQQTTMEKLRGKLDAGTSLTFTDNVYVLQSQPASATATDNQQVNTLLGLDHNVVRKIFIATPEAADYGNPVTSGNPLLGNYHSLSSNLKQTLQVTVNSEPYFNNPLDSFGKIQNQLNQCEVTSHKINQAVQSPVGQVDSTSGAYVAAQQQLTDKTMNGTPQQAQQGCGAWLGIPLTRSYANTPGAGTPIGRQSVLLEMRDQRCATGNVAKQVHIWAECERQLMMGGGKILVSGA